MRNKEIKASLKFHDVCEALRADQEPKLRQGSVPVQHENRSSNSSMHPQASGPLAAFVCQAGRPRCGEPRSPHTDICGLPQPKSEAEILSSMWYLEAASPDARNHTSSAPVCEAGVPAGVHVPMVAIYVLLQETARFVAKKVLALRCSCWAPCTQTMEF